MHVNSTGKVKAMLQVLPVLQHSQQFTKDGRLELCIESIPRWKPYRVSVQSSVPVVSHTQSEPVQSENFSLVSHSVSGWTAQDLTEAV